MASITKQAHCANNPSHPTIGQSPSPDKLSRPTWAVGNPYPQTGKQRAEVRLRTRQARVLPRFALPPHAGNRRRATQGQSRERTFFRTVNSAGVRLQCCRRARLRTSQARWTRYCCLPSLLPRWNRISPVAKSRRTRTVTRLEQANETRNPLLTRRHNVAVSWPDLCG